MKDLFPDMPAGISAAELRDNLDEWLENPFWAEYYYGAPSDRCRLFIALEFRHSDYEDDASARTMDGIEEKMDAAELRYLLKYCGNNPRKKALHDRIAAAESGH